MTFNINENTINTLNSFVSVLDIKVSKYEVLQKVKEHPEPGSILCVSDCLRDWKIPNAVIKVKKDDLNNLPLPYVTVINDGENFFFTVVKESNENYIHYLSNKNQKYVKVSVSEFLEIWEQIVLIAEPDKNSGENQYNKNKYKHLIAPCCVSVLAFVLFFLATGYQFNISRLFSLVASYIGIAASFILQLQEKRQVPLIDRICSSVSKGDCHSVTNSKGSKLFSILNWSDIGFVYFLAYVINAIINPNGCIINYISLLSILYIFYSVLYQWLYIKQWCILCLVVQFALLLQGIIAFIHCLDITHQLIGTDIIALAISFIISSVICYFEKNIIVIISKLQKENIQLKRVKFNSNCFNSLLSNSLELEKVPFGLVLGEEKDYSHSIIAVCNPFCGPCGQAHISLDKLLEKCDNLQVKIIFTTSTDYKDSEAYKITEYFLLLQDFGTKQELAEAMNFWYKNNKDINCVEIIKDKFPIKMDPNISKDKEIKEMYEWTENVGITETPTIYFDGRKLLREYYSIEDLKYFINL